MAVAQALERDRAERLQTSQAQDRVNGSQPMDVSSPLPTSIPQNLSAQEQFDAQTAQTQANQGALDTNPAVSRMNDSGFVQGDEFDEYTKFLQEQTQKIRSASSVAMVSALLQQIKEREGSILDKALTEEQREQLEGFRIKLWQSVQTSLPAITDTVWGLDFGLFSWMAFGIILYRLNKGIKYRTSEEPLNSVATILTPPKVRFLTKNPVKMTENLSRIATDLTALGEAIVGIVFGLLVLFLVLFLMYLLYYFFVDPLTGATIPEVRQAASELNVNLIDVATVSDN